MLSNHTFVNSYWYIPLNITEKGYTHKVISTYQETGKCVFKQLYNMLHNQKSVL